MSTNALGTILGALALGGVGVLYLKIDKLSDDVQAVVAQRSPAKSRRAQSDHLVSHGRTVRAAPAAAEDEARRPGAERVGEADAASPRSLEERIRELEQAQEKRSARADADGRWRMPGLARSMPVRSVDDLAKRLELTPTQRARVQAAVELGKRRIQDLMKIPDASGTSPHERRQARRKKLREAFAKGEHGGLVSLATDMFSYRNRDIPGQNTTYGDEMDRIRDETRSEVASALSPEQAKDFEDTNIDPLVGAESGMQISFVGTADGPDGHGEVTAGAVIVDAGARVEVEEGEAISPPPPARGGGREPPAPADDG